MVRTLTVAVTSISMAVAVGGCGYHLAHGGAALGPFAVSLAPVRVPDVAVAAEAEQAARAALAREGELGSGSEVGSIEIEMVRVDEAPEAIALALGAGSGSIPLARASRVTVIGRARLRRAGLREVARETGEMHASETTARALTVGAAAVARDEAARAAARRLGEMLVRRLLGAVEPGEP